MSIKLHTSYTTRKILTSNIQNKYNNIIYKHIYIYTYTDKCVIEYSWNEQCEAEFKPLLDSLTSSQKTDRPKGRGGIRIRTNVPTPTTTLAYMLLGWDGGQKYLSNEFCNDELQN